jgi:hypothetical protein
MSDISRPVDCYIHSFANSQLEPYLERNGFGRGMLIFAIPEFGVLFKCRAEGDPLDLEFGAFLSLMRFIKKSLGREKIRALHLHSSSPEFVFSFTDKQLLLAAHPERMKALAEYASGISISVSYIRKLDNKAVVPAADYPSAPLNQTPVIRPSEDDPGKTQFKPFQKGIRL